MSASLAVFRADATASVGGGHVSRCMALADGLADQGWACAFAGAPETPSTFPALAASRHGFVALTGCAAEEPGELAQAFPAGTDVLIADHYARDGKFEAACRPWARLVMVIDDLADRPHDCEILLDQTLGKEAADYAALTPPECTFLLGPEHALLRPAFAAARAAAVERRRTVSPVRRICINMGASDPENVTAKALRAMVELDAALAVDVIIGPQAPHLADMRILAAEIPRDVSLHVGVDAAAMAGLLARADLAIGSAGVATWERLCLGLPAIVIPFAGNQSMIAESLKREGAAHVLGWHSEIGANDIAAAVAELMGDDHRRMEMSVTAAGICDGAGVRRVVDALMSCLSLSAASARAG
jgi:UDP-2,4-diacetamido-2,4,6-trideoxy-beta-L-altropyranose hydrolase